MQFRELIKKTSGLGFGASQYADTVREQHVGHVTISHLYVLRQFNRAAVLVRADHHQRLDIDQALIVPCKICAGHQWSTCAVDACVQLGLSSDLRELHGQRRHFASSRLLVALHAATKPR